jgi:hypothetical protein
MISTLKTQDGVHYLTAELNGDVVADRDLEAAWQEWDVLPDPFNDPSVRVLKSAHGKYLSAYSPEYCAQLGLPPGTVKATAEHPDVWERWRAVRDGQVVRLQSAQWGLWLSPQNVPPCAEAGGGAVYCNGPDPAAWEALTASNIGAFPGAGTGPTQPGHVTPLVGPVRLLGKSFGDGTGPRILHGATDFGALRRLKDQRDQTLRDLDILATHCHYVRIAVRLNGGDDFWGMPWPDANGWPMTLDPLRDPWVEDMLRQYLQECHNRGLRVNLTSADMYNWSDQQAEDWFRRCGQIAASVSPEVVWLFAVANEMRGTWPDGESDENVAKMAHYLRVWQEVYPGSLLAGSDPGSQDGDGMRRLAPSPANVALIHDVRWSVPDAIRRAFNSRYENYPGKPIVQDEPTGPNGVIPGPFGQKVYQPVNDYDDVLAIYFTHAYTGQASTWFDDSALIDRQSLAANWGCKEIPAIWREMELPEDIGQGEPYHGGREECAMDVRGSNADRADCTVAPDGRQAFGTISGEHGGWKVKSRWDAQFFARTAAGVVADQHVSVGEVLPVSGATPTLVRFRR